MISLALYGRFRLTDAQGEDVTPVGQKARGLIALLALSKEHCRTREWLQDKLWSESTPQNGAASLRQSLMDIRRALGQHTETLITGRDMIALDPRHFTLVQNRPLNRQGSDAYAEIFSDLNIRDPEFEDWIRDQRLALATISPLELPRELKLGAPIKPAIFFRSSTDNSPESDLITRHLLTLATTSLLDAADLQIFHTTAASNLQRDSGPAAGLAVSVATMSRSGHAHVTLSVVHPVSGQVFWSHSYQLSASQLPFDEEKLHPISAALVEAVLMALKQHAEDLGIPDCAALIAKQGRDLIFRFDRNSLIVGDRCLEQAYAYSPRPQYLAWRAFLRTMANFQHRGSDFLSSPVEIETLAREAIRQAPESAITLGIGAQVEYLLGGSPRTSVQLASRAVGFDPLNAINLAILSNTELVLGRLNEGRSAALHALHLAGAGEDRAFIEFFCCMAAAAQADYQAAIDHAEAALILRPDFRAPLRYLVALYSHTDQGGNLQRVLGKLRGAEPGFKPERLLDNDYPVTTLRRMPLIEAVARQSS